MEKKEGTLEFLSSITRFFKKKKKKIRNTPRSFVLLPLPPRKKPKRLFTKIDNQGHHRNPKNGQMRTSPIFMWKTEQLLSSPHTEYQSK